MTECMTVEQELVILLRDEVADLRAEIERLRALVDERTEQRDEARGGLTFWRGEWERRVQ